MKYMKIMKGDERMAHASPFSRHTLSMVLIFNSFVLFMVKQIEVGG